MATGRWPRALLCPTENQGSPHMCIKIAERRGADPPFLRTCGGANDGDDRGERLHALTVLTRSANTGGDLA